MHDATNITIPYPSVTISKEYFPQISSHFGDQTETCWSAVKASTFPQRIKEISAFNLTLIQLLYLASLESNDKKSLFSQKELKILNDSYKKSMSTTWSLRIGLIVNTALFAGVALFPLIPTSTGSNQNATLPTNSTNQTSSVSPTQDGLITAVAFIGVLTNGVSFFATGFAPDTSSNAFNTKQDLLEGIKNKFDNLAKRLLMLYLSKEKNEAKKIARAIDIKNLKIKCLESTQNREKTRQILTLMKETLFFINSKEEQIPGNADLLTLIKEKTL